MAHLKNRKYDLIAKYRLTFEISLILSLVLLIVSFTYFPNIEQKKKIFEAPQELFSVEEVQHTQQQNVPPPPPKPNIVIAVPTDEVLEDIEISTTELDVNAVVEKAPPPMKEEHKVVMEEEPSYFVAVEEMPEPIGGIKAIQEKLVYPEIARRAGIEGTVYVLAYLDEQGTVVKTEIMKGLGGGCDESASSAVAKTKFSPGKQRGKPVRVKVMVPIKFQLQSS